VFQCQFYLVIELTLVQGISTLCRYGLDRETGASSHEALRCLANAFLLNEPSRQIFVDLQYATKAVERLKGGDLDDEFLLCRILFLLTYNTNVNFVMLADKHGLTESINQCIAHHSTAFSKSGRRKSRTSPIEEMAMVEALKLMFNVTHFDPELTPNFTPSIEPLVNMLVHYHLPSPPLQSPITYILNALLNLDLSSAEKKTPMGREAKTSPLFPYSTPEKVVDRMGAILFRAMKEHPERDLDEGAATLITLLRRLYEIASPQMKSWMRWLLLPNEKDRDQPLGKGDTLSARLLQLSTSPSVPNLRENISSLLFELSDKDANKFVENIGYGFAAGFLMNNKIEVPKNAAEASSSTRDGGADVNPVTGQRWSAEDKQKADLPEMTEEEKEREAERLFVLFERLRATGVVDIKNPVQQAIDEGRFEELD
jgi:hypothetical protein